jgi:hypothetical protein
VAQIVEAEMIKPGGPASSDEGLGHPIGLPRHEAELMTREDERIGVVSLFPCALIGLFVKKLLAVAVQRSPMTAAGLGRSKNGTVRAFDESALIRQAPIVEVDILPSQGQELAAASARGCSQNQEQMKEWLVGGDVVQQLDHLLGRGTGHSERRIEVVDHHRLQLPNQHVPQLGLELS